MCEGKLKPVQKRTNVSIFTATETSLDGESITTGWHLTGHCLDDSSFLCAETSQHFLVRWNKTNGSILEKKVTKAYLVKELGDYAFDNESFRWCAALNVIDDERVPTQGQRADLSLIR